MRYPPPPRKALTGVWYIRPDRRPVWKTRANPGSHPAIRRVAWLVTRRLKRATPRGIGIAVPPHTRPSGYAASRSARDGDGAEDTGDDDFAGDAREFRFGTDDQAVAQHGGGERL